MSTRAVYSFIGDGEIHHVYKHCDGYPTGAADAIKNAMPHAWPLPRFEADEFAAAFVAGNKLGTGGVRLTPGFDRHGDLEYRYEIGFRFGELYVTAYEVDYNDGSQTSHRLFAGSLDKFASWAQKAQAGAI